MNNDSVSGPPQASAHSDQVISLFDLNDDFLPLVMEVPNNNKSLVLSTSSASLAHPHTSRSSQAASTGASLKRKDLSSSSYMDSVHCRHANSSGHSIQSCSSSSLNHAPDPLCQTHDSATPSSQTENRSGREEPRRNLQWRNNNAQKSQSSLIGSYASENLDLELLSTWENVTNQQSYNSSTRISQPRDLASSSGAEAVNPVYTQTESRFGREEPRRYLLQRSENSQEAQNGLIGSYASENLGLEPLPTSQQSYNPSGRTYQPQQPVASSGEEAINPVYTRTESRFGIEEPRRNLRQRIENSQESQNSFIGSYASEDLDLELIPTWVNVSSHQHYNPGRTSSQSLNRDFIQIQSRFGIEEPRRNPQQRNNNDQELQNSLGGSYVADDHTSRLQLTLASVSNQPSFCNPPEPRRTPWQRTENAQESQSRTAGLALVTQPALENASSHQNYDPSSVHMGPLRPSGSTFQISPPATASTPFSARRATELSSSVQDNNRHPESGTAIAPPRLPRPWPTDLQDIERSRGARNSLNRLNSSSAETGVVVHGTAGLLSSVQDNRLSESGMTAALRRLQQLEPRPGLHGGERNTRVRGASNRLNSSSTEDTLNSRVLSLQILATRMMLNPSAISTRRRWFDRLMNMRLDVDNMSYEELLELGERIGSVNTGLSEDQMSKCLAENIYISEDKPKEKTCAICLEDYKDWEIFGTLKCEHHFHSSCVKEWLKLKNSCPMCKADAWKQKTA